MEASTAGFEPKPLAAKWHICATINSFDENDGETPTAQVASTHVFPVDAEWESEEEEGDGDDDLNNAILALDNGTDSSGIGLPGSWSRIFHPKGTALGVQANSNAPFIANARVGAGSTGGGSAPTCNAGDEIKKDDVNAAITSVMLLSDW